MEGTKVKSTKVIKNAGDTSFINAGYKSNEGDNIKVYLRIRPPSKNIQDVDNDLCLEVCSSTSLKIATRPEPKQFSYDLVAGMETTQEEVFSTVGKGIIEAFVDGFNGTIFAYGQTGSGKTFTMLGPPDDSDDFSHELRGVIPRSFEYIFSLINRQQDKVGDRVEFLAKCSFLEIYNESVYDLLEPSAAGLALRENIKKGVFVEGLAERTVISAKEAYSVLQSGWLNRRVASTSMNRESSRSHAVFTVTLESKTKSGGVANIKESKLHLVDLAGSERQKDTQTVDLRLKEAGSINKSLSALGNVIMALVDIAHGKTRYIHYRDSKLTFILRDSLGGNAKTYIIANVHPSSKCFGETLSTLNFARRAKMIKNNAVVNEDVTGNVSELRAEIRKLKEELAQSQSSGNLQKETVEAKVKDIPIGAPPDVYEQQSDDAIQWQQMMLSAIAETENVETEKLALQEKIEKLEEIVEKKNKFVQSTRMILKFRNVHITKLERKLKKEIGLVDEDSEKDQQIKLLRDEIKCLQTSIEHHPDVKKFSQENSELRSEIKQLKALDPTNGYLKKEMAEKHRYTMQLERQLRELMTSKNIDLSNSQQNTEVENTEVENTRMELAQVQVKLESTQKDLQEERKNAKLASEEYHSNIEIYRNTEMELQCNLAAAEKAKNELQHNLESFQLKTVIERTTMNSLHMQTVKTLVSPRTFASPRKFGMPRTPFTSLSDKSSSTPHKKENMNGNMDVSANGHQNGKNSSDGLEDVTQPLLIDSFDDYSDSDGDQVDIVSEVHTDETREEEMICIDVLQEELGQVQKLYNKALEDLSKEQKKQLPLKEKLTKFEIKVNELGETLQAERQSFATKESELSAQLVSAQDKYKDLYGNNTLLKNEAGDYKVMYTSLGKQLDTTKKQKDEAHIEAGRKYAALESKYTELQIDFYNLRGEMEQTLALNNNLQSDFEQCKEELQFTRHKNAELKDLVNEEKSKVKERQDALEKLEAMIDLQEESNKATETLNALRGQLHDLTKVNDEHENTIVRMESGLELSRSEVAEQIRLNLSDKEVINNFMKTVEDLNVTIIEKENLVTSLKSEVQDYRKELAEYRELYDKEKEKTRSSEKLNTSLKCECERLNKEKDENENKCVNLLEEIQQIHKTHTELRCTLTNDHQQQIQFLETEKIEKERLLNEKNKQIFVLEENLAKLNNQKSEHSNVSPDNFITCNENFNNLSESWDTFKIEGEKKLSEKKKLDGEVLESRISMLEMEFEDSESQLKETQENVLVLEGKINELEEEKAEKVILFEQTLVAKEKLVVENKNLQREMEKLNMNLCNIQEDLHVNLEELEKTKALEQKYFEDNNQLQSRVAVVGEEKTRYAKQSKQLQKQIDVLEIEKAKLVAHKNTNQRIDHLVAIKKENNSLKEEVRTMKENVNKCPNCTKLTAKC